MTKKELVEKVKDLEFNLDKYFEFKGWVRQNMSNQRSCYGANEATLDAKADNFLGKVRDIIEDITKSELKKPVENSVEE